MVDLRRYNYGLQSSQMIIIHMHHSLGHFLAAKSSFREEARVHGQQITRGATMSYFTDAVIFCFSSCLCRIIPKALAAEEVVTIPVLFILARLLDNSAN
jgi:hypothetical protein